MEGKRPCNKKPPRRGGSSFHLEASRDSRLPRTRERFKAEQAVLWGLEDRNEYFAKQKSLYQEEGGWDDLGKLLSKVTDGQKKVWRWRV